MRKFWLFPVILSAAACSTSVDHNQHCTGVCPVDGTCGSAAGSSRPAAPASDLCSAGTASEVSGVGPWSWTCVGINGGADAQCSAPVGPADGTITLGYATTRANEGGEGGVNDFFAYIELSSTATHQVTVKMATVDGTAHAGVDYQAIAPTTLTLDPGTRWLAVNLYNDGAFEGDRTFQFVISEPGNGAVLGDVTATTVTIVDDDPPPEGIIGYKPAWFDHGSPVSMGAYAGHVTVPVSRIGGSSGAVSVHYATVPGGSATPGDDYTDVSGTLSWADGDSTDKSFVIPVVRDVVYEELDTVLIKLDSPTGGGYLGIRSDGGVHLDEYFTEHTYQPVLQPSSSGADFDSSAVTAPSVLKLADASYVMFYEGQKSGTFRLGRAVSTDGITWTKSPTTAVTTFEVLDPSVLFDGATYRMWYGKTVVGVYYATSSDGLTWTEQNGGTAVLQKSSTSSDWDGQSIFSPTVIADGGGYVMWYNGTTIAGYPAVGRATSSDGIAWTKDATNPQLSAVSSSWDNMGVRDPSVIKDGTTYWMVYTGMSSYWRLGIAMSTDGGVTWTKDTQPLMYLYNGQWDQDGYGSPSLLLDGETMTVWFRGYGSAPGASIGRVSDP